jgi:serine protease Do
MRLVAIALVAWLGMPLSCGAAPPPRDWPGNLPDLVASLLPAVVNISILMQQPRAGGSVAQGAEEMSRPIKEFGSGFLIDPSGYIVTNRHVVAAAYEVTVTLADGHPYPASVLSTNERPDLALLKIEAGRALPTVPWGDSGALRIGQTVIAIGNPLGLSSTVTVGVVSALNRDLNETMIDDFIQTDAAINHGNSGGPLFNLAGEVIGVNSALFTPDAANRGSAGLGLAIPSEDASFVVDQMRRYGHLRAGFVGLRLQQTSPAIASLLGLPNTEGGIVTAVWPDGPGARADVHEGDVVLQFGDRHTTDVRALLRAMGTTLPGTSAPMVVWRDGHTRTVTVAVASWPKEEGMYDPAGPPAMPDRGRRMTSPDLGLHMVALTDQLRSDHKLAPDQGGVLVLGVEANSAAADVGVSPGDLILSVQSTPVSSPDDVLRGLAALREQGREAGLLLLRSRDRPHWEVVPLKGS